MFDPHANTYTLAHMINIQDNYLKKFCYCNFIHEQKKTCIRKKKKQNNQLQHDKERENKNKK